MPGEPVSPVSPFPHRAGDLKIRTPKAAQLYICTMRSTCRSPTEWKAAFLLLRTLATSPPWISNYTHCSVPAPPTHLLRTRRMSWFMVTCVLTGTAGPSWRTGASGTCWTTGKKIIPSPADSETWRSQPRSLPPGHPPQFSPQALWE